MDKVYVVAGKDAPFKEKAKAWIENRKTDVKCMVRWAKDHKAETVGITIAVCGLAKTATKVIGKTINLQKEKTLKTRMVWDPTIGQWYETKRELKNAERIILDERVRNGESRGQVLSDLGLLKK